MWRDDGALMSYMYHPEKVDNCGDNWYWGGSTATAGRWMFQKTFIKMNDPGAPPPAVATVGCNRLGCGVAMRSARCCLHHSVSTSQCDSHVRQTEAAARSRCPCAPSAPTSAFCSWLRATRCVRSSFRFPSPRPPSPSARYATCASVPVRYDEPHSVSPRSNRSRGGGSA